MVRIGQWPGCTAQHPCRLRWPRTVSRKQLCQPAAITRQTAPGRARQGALTQRKAKCPWKGCAHTTACSCQHEEPGSQSVSRFHRLTDLPPARAPAQTTLAEFWWLLFPSLPPGVGHSWFSDSLLLPERRLGDLPTSAADTCPLALGWGWELGVGGRCPFQRELGRDRRNSPFLQRLDCQRVQ